MTRRGDFEADQSLPDISASPNAASATQHRLSQKSTLRMQSQAITAKTKKVESCLDA